MTARSISVEFGRGQCLPPIGCVSTAALRSPTAMIQSSLREHLLGPPPYSLMQGCPLSHSRATRERMTQRALSYRAVTLNCNYPIT
jgi:hypothetical protein